MVISILLSENMIRQSAEIEKEAETLTGGVYRGVRNPSPQNGGIGSVASEDRKAAFQKEFGPFVRQMIRDEVRSLLNLQHQEGEDHQLEARAEAETLSSATVPPVSAKGGPTVDTAVSQIREDLSVEVMPFDPKEMDWYSFKVHFNALAQPASWSERTKVIKMLTALQGSHIGVTDGLEQPVQYDDLISHIDSIYALENDQENAMSKLQSCKMEYGESVSQFAESVRQLVNRAYPNFTNVDREEQTLRVFLKGLPTANDMRMKMRLKRFTSLKDATEYGTHLVQVLKDEGFDENGKQVRARTSTKVESNVLKVVEKISKSLDKLEESLNQDEGLSVPMAEDQPGKPDLELCQSAGHKGKNGKGRREIGGSKPNPKTHPCYLCGQLGHWLKDCLFLKEVSENFRLGTH